MWADKIIESMQQSNVDTHIINDSKTPSGRVHVGSLRGVLVHDAINRLANNANLNSKFIYGIDDFDPMDGLPSDSDEAIKQHMGKPLFAVPSPETGYSDMADFYISEFLGLFDTLGVKAEVYRMRDMYRSGKLDAAIEQILQQVDKIREVYADFSRHKNNLSNWYPFQTICENCHKIATTKCHDFDGKEVSYTCETDLVTWATGCGHKGKVSPFGGTGKMPWKIEWIAKWHSFNVSLEGAGKDHSTKGGSRDVANRCYSSVFGKRPPISVPYEFFLMQGAKMSSSKGIGFSAKEMVDFLPPEIVRFLMLRQQPKKTVNFSVEATYTTKLFNEYDQLVAAVAKGNADKSKQDTLQASAVGTAKTQELPAFQLIMALAKMPHINVIKAILDKNPKAATDDEYVTAVTNRVASVNYWLQHFAESDELIEVQMVLPEKVQHLPIEKKSFLRLLAKKLHRSKPIDSNINATEIYQTLLFDVARLIPIAPNDAFNALYVALLDRDLGPKGGSLIAYLGPHFIAQRLKNVSRSKISFWRKTAVTTQEIIQFIESQKETVVKVTATLLSAKMFNDTDAKNSYLYAMKISIYLDNGKIHIRRSILGDIDDADGLEQAKIKTTEFIEQIKQKFACKTKVIIKNNKQKNKK